MLAAFNIPAFDQAVPPIILFDSEHGLTLNSATVTASNAFDNVAWVKARCTVTPDATADPFGGIAADSMVEDGTLGTHVLTQALANVVTGIPISYSLYAKAGARTWFVLFDASVNGVYVNLATGTFGTVLGTLSDKQIIPVGNGWYQILITFVAPTNTFYIGMAVADNNSSYAGDGVSNIFLYGAQAIQHKPSALADQSFAAGSGAANAHDFIQATASLQSLLVPNGWGGKPCIRLDGADDFYATAGFGLAQPVTSILAYVIRVFGGAAAHDILADGTDAINHMAIGSIDANSYAISAGVALSYASPPFLANRGVVASHVWNGASSQFRINRQQRASGNVGTNNPLGITLGAIAGGTRSYAADIFFGAWFNGVVSDQVIDKWERWLAAKYKIGLDL